MLPYALFHQYHHIMTSNTRTVGILLLCALASWPAAGQQFVETAPEDVGFSGERLARLDAVIEHNIAEENLAGAVSFIARKGKAVRFRAYGMRDREAEIPMTTDTIFRIASMSKAVTSVAVMILYEEGHFLLGDPVSSFIPEFKDAVVAVAPPEDAPDSVAFVTERAKRPISIHDLLTHKAGLTYGSGLASDAYQEAGLSGWYFADREETIGDAITRLATLPLHGHPGDAWQYGFSTDVLGYFVEVVSGMPLDQFFKERIFDPLKMEDTSFFLPPEKADRLAPVYGIGASGALELREPTATTDYIHGPRQCFSGGAGLLSTTSDYGRFLQMLLQGGQLDGARILSPKTVELMQADNSGDMYPWDKTGFGLGFWVVTDVGQFGELGSHGAYGWGSAYYPIYWIDPEEELIGMIMTQLMPAGGLTLNRLFTTLTYQALVD